MEYSSNDDLKTEFDEEFKQDGQDGAKEHQLFPTNSCISVAACITCGC